MRRFCILSAVIVVALTVSALVTVLFAPQGHAVQVDGGTVTIETVPAIGGVEFRVGSASAVSAPDGTARISVSSLADIEDRLEVVPSRVGAGRRVELDRLARVSEPSGEQRLVVGLRTSRLVETAFVGPDGQRVEAHKITEIALKSNIGERVTLRGQRVRNPVWLVSSGIRQAPDGGLASTDLYWTVERVVLGGAQVVNENQQKFVPREQQDWEVELLLFDVSVSGTDFLFGGTAGEGVELFAPDGSARRLPFVDGEVRLADLPRGAYEVRVFGSGVSFTRPVGISRNQELVLTVITPLDIWIAGSAVGGLALGLILVGRRKLLISSARRLRNGRGLSPAAARRTRSALRRATPAAALVAAVLLSQIGANPTQARGAETESAPPSQSAVPLLAYYYIWFNPTSWRRAKTDYPLLGRYSSADPEVMRQHIEMAKSAGIDGFLVSWKHSDFLDPRLDLLVDIARKHRFKLGIVYQGLDFDRRPLPAPRIARDLQFFADRYASDPVFGLFGNPVVVVTGTEKFTVEELRLIAEPVRSRLQVLASAKNVRDYARTSPVVAGNAYYWSSGDPSKPIFASKLSDMAKAVRSSGGMWLAPAPAAFDARKLGGKRVIPRRGGATLRDGIEVARSTSPDAVAVISWNEFSENSHIEPSEGFGTSALDSLAATTGATIDMTGLPDSSESMQVGRGLPGWVAFVIMGCLAAVLGGFGAVSRRRQRLGLNHVSSTRLE